MRSGVPVSAGAELSRVRHRRAFPISGIHRLKSETSHRRATEMPHRFDRERRRRDLRRERRMRPAHRERGAGRRRRNHLAHPGGGARLHRNAQRRRWRSRRNADRASHRGERCEPSAHRRRSRRHRRSTFAHRGRARALDRRLRRDARIAEPGEQRRFRAGRRIHRRSGRGRYVDRVSERVHRREHPQRGLRRRRDALGRGGGAAQERTPARIPAASG